MRYSLKPQTWAFSAALIAAVLAAAALVMLKLLWAATWAVVSVALWAATRAWNRRDPIPFPYVLRPLLLLPRGPHSPEHLIAILAPVAGERILEIGPGTGTHALPVARAVAPRGVLEALDIQRAMLEHVSRRAAEAGISNIVTTQADAQALPYPDRSFDASYMVGALGEIPDQHAALRELNRILKPGGRLIIGELFLDPDFVPLSDLTMHAAAAGLVLERTRGPRSFYFARFRPTATGAHGPPEAGGSVTREPSPAPPPA